MKDIRRFLLGPPLRSVEARHQRLTKAKALAVFSSDALSSVAYATEEILLVLVAAGAGALWLSVPITLSIIALLGIVAVSYRQTIHAYPSGGGSYIVAKHNLGVLPGLVAGSALLVDYVLTVAVSVAAGVAAITSAFPALAHHRVGIALIFIALITLANLRGVRESANIFAAPTYFFIGSITLVLLAGLGRWLLGGNPAEAAVAASAAAGPVEGGGAIVPLSLFVVLRAFASGCAAMTGVEAISNGVPAFKEPESHNAATTLTWMAIILATMFIGISLLAVAFGIRPSGEETVISQIARVAFGRGVLYYAVQFSTALILVLAANTSYADFPRLASLMAKDGFLPRQFANRGDRLVFSNGIIILGVLSGLLVAIFGGRTHAMIPLYAVGVFLSFTLSQSGMVRHWLKTDEPGRLLHAVVNGLGATATGLVLLVIAGSKFIYGAWAVVILIPLLVWMLTRVRVHYDEVAAELAITPEELGGSLPVIEHDAVVPVASINRALIDALQYAKSLSSRVYAIHVTIDPKEGERMKREWEKWGFGVPLTVLYSPYRSLIRPLIEFIDRIDRRHPKALVTVVLPEFVPSRWWHVLLHNQAALSIKTALLFRRGTIVTSVPYHLHGATPPEPPPA
ncbi:MAG: APC family permease [Bacillota bacterium]